MSMNRLLNNLPFILPVLVLAGVAVYALWFRELPRADGRITGDYESARMAAVEGGVPLFVVVDQSPH
jgi:hypothetical protein